MKYLKTPLRYPGGKSRVAPKLIDKFPKDIGEFHFAPSLVEDQSLLFSQKYPHIPVWVNDKYEYLYHFMDQSQKNGDDLSDALVEAKETTSPKISPESYLSLLKKVYPKQTLLISFSLCFLDS